MSFLKTFLPKYPHIARLLVVIFFSSAFFGTELVANWRTLAASSQTLGNIDVNAETLASPSPVVRPGPSPKVKVVRAGINTSSPSPTPSPQTQGAKTSNNPLCRGVSGEWKMIPEPGREGMYVICNIVEEKVGTSDELNAALNNYRKEHGLGTLFINSGLCKVAGERAHEILINFSHDGFEAATKRSGVNARAFGENIASGALSATKFVEWSWDRSPGHKANMLGDWTDGCGAIWDKYAVFLFAKI